MGQMKKLLEVLESYDKLPNGQFKNSIKEDMEQLKKISNYKGKNNDKWKNKTRNRKEKT